MTRLPPPLRVTPEEAVEILMDLAEYVKPIPLVATDYQRAIALMAQLNLPGGGIFDAVIAQAALKTSVDRLMTFNAKDFVRLGQEISALVQVPK
jgi:predicted nucleic acid-binding protein